MRGITQFCRVSRCEALFYCLSGIFRAGVKGGGGAGAGGEVSK